MSLTSRLIQLRDVGMARFPRSAGVLTTFVVRVASAALSYLMFIAIGHTSTAIDYRDFALVFTAIGFCAPLAAMGSGQTVFKYLPIMIEEGHGESHLFARHIFGIVLRGILLFAVIGGLIVTQGVARQLDWTFYLVLFAIIATGAFSEILSSFYTVIGSVPVSVAIRELSWRVVLTGGVLAYFKLFGQLGLTQLCLALLLSYVVMLLAFTGRMSAWMLQVWRATGALTMHIPRKQFWSFFGLAVLGLAVIHLDTMILGLAQQSVGLGAFFSAQRTTQVLFFFGQSIGIFAGPIISKQYALGNYREITQFSRRVMLLAGGPTVLCGVVIALLAAPIMSLFRPEFTDYAILLQILLFAPILHTIGGLHVQIPTFCGGEHVYLKWRIILVAIMIPIKIAVAIWGTMVEFAVVTVLDALLVVAMGLVVSRVKCKVPAA